MERTRKLYQVIASCLIARSNCANDQSRLEWFDRWTDNLETLAREFLPSGSGVDSGTSIDWDRSTKDKIILHASYHHMNDDGYYDGWTSHSITIRPDWEGFHLTIGGRDRNQIKDYLGDLFHYALSQDIIETSDGYRLA